MAILIKNIKELVQVEAQPVQFVAGKKMAGINTIKDSWLFIKDGSIADFGLMSELSMNKYINVKELTEIDAHGRMVFPAFCDSHTHLVYPASREIEYIDKIRGLSYEEIAKRGGGILNSSRLLQETSEDGLYEQSFPRLEEIISQGTGAVEIKSGYGLTTASELKMLRVIKRLKENSPLTIKSTFLGAHSVPMEYRNNQEKYVDITR